MSMQGPGPNQLNMTNNSMNMPSSTHGSMGGYNHSVPSSQSIPGQNQMTMSQGQPMGNYGPRPNISMQPNQGKSGNYCFLPVISENHKSFLKRIKGKFSVSSR